MPVLNESQLDTFMKLIDEDEHWRDFFYAELTTGLMRGEVCGLKWTDFDEQNGKLNINRSKSFKGGKVVEGETKTGKGKRRKSGTGCISKLGDNLYEADIHPKVLMVKESAEMYTPKLRKSANANSPK